MKYSVLYFSLFFVLQFHCFNYAYSQKTPLNVIVKWNILSNNTGTWTTDNREYKSINEPFEQYQLQWSYDIGKNSLTGKMFGLIEGKEPTQLWEFKTFWDAVKNKAIIFQISPDGSYGLSESELFSDSLEQSFGVFHYSNGTKDSIKHQSITTPKEHITTSFVKDRDGHWSPDRVYHWFPSQSFLDLDEKSEYKIDSIMMLNRDSSDFNGVLLIGNKSSILYNKTFGYKDLSVDNKEQLSVDSKFYLASITKNLVAVSILKLIEDGKLNLDTKLVNIFPKVNNKYKEISIENLLKHTSGLPNDYTQFYSEHNKNSFDNNDIFNLMVRGMIPLSFKPNEKHEYSNIGYILLSLVIEKVSGKNLSQYINSMLNNDPKFELFGIDTTNFITSFFKDSLNVWKPYQTGSYDGMMEKTYGDGGLIASSKDLYRYGVKLIDTSIIGKASYERMTTKGKLIDGTKFNYGYGLRVFPEKDFHYHGGGSWGYSHIFAIYPQRELIVVLLSNSDLWGQIGSVFKEVEQILFN